MTELALAKRDGLPDALRVLVAEYPRDGWTSDPGFEGLVRFWLDRHLMFRRLMTEMTKNTQAMLDKKLDPQRYLAALSRYGGMFVNGLHEHHTIEDDHYFPKLAAMDARIESGFAILDKDHHTLDAFLQKFVEGANMVLRTADDTTRLQTAAGRLHTQLTDLERLLDRHLQDEEDLIVPLILRYGAPDMG